MAEQQLRLVKSDADELTLSLDGWEGPLDLLLELARGQKVDLAQISILQLVEQYLAYLAEARALKLEIAADYLVMAAWLTYLKSCLLLPKDPEADPSPEEIALRLQMRLQRLDAMREAGARLIGRDRIGRDVFVRGAPEGLRLVRKSAWHATAFDLLRGLWRGQGAHPAGAPHRPCAGGDDSGRSDRPGQPDDRDRRRLGRDRGVPAGDRRPAAAQVVACLQLRRRARACAPGAARARAGAAVRDAPGQGRLMDELVRAVEATLFASASPLSVDEIQEHVGEGDVAAALARLAELYEGHGIELVERGGRWHFQTAPDLAHLLRRTREESRRLSRAATETLAIIAYNEPVSRAEIEAIRGVQISKGTLDVLMEAGWVRTAGRRESPGRPLLYATTADFLAHFGLGSRRDLPGIDDLKAAGLLDPLDEAAFAAMGELQLERGDEED